MKRNEDFVKLSVTLTYVSTTSRCSRRVVGDGLKLQNVLEMENHSQAAKRTHQSCMAWVGLSDARLHAQAAEQPGMGAAPLQKGFLVLSLLTSNHL